MCADPTTRRGAQTRAVLTILDESRGNFFFFFFCYSLRSLGVPAGLVTCALCSVNFLWW